MRHQERQVRDALAQRWHVNAQDGQTVIQIRAKGASLYSYFQRNIGGRCNAHVNGYFALPTDAFNDAFFQDA